MTRIILSILTVVLFNTIYAQKPVATPGILSSKQIDMIFPDSVKHRLGITYPVYRVYQYSDRSGKYYCILTESSDSVNHKGDTLNHFIRAVTCKIGSGGLEKIREMNDQVTEGPNEEDNIWFWTKYIEFADYDNDGLVEPLIIYGSTGMNGHDDGRIKFLIYYKDQKIAIRHQNGVLDFERETRVDKGFYLLPLRLQSSVKQKMGEMEKRDQAIFPRGWQAAMKERKTVFNER